MVHTFGILVLFLMDQILIGKRFLLYIRYKARSSENSVSEQLLFYTKYV